MNLFKPVAASRRECRGVSLVECLVYISVFVLLTGLAYKAYYRCLDAYREFNRKAGHVVQALRVGEAWRQDVRSCIEMPSIQPDEDGAALRLRQKDGELTYLFLKGAVYRKTEAQAEPALLLTNVHRSVYAREERGPVVVWTWELELATKAKAARLKPLLSFQAVASSAHP